jgi:hypothetical protein
MLNVIKNNFAVVAGISLPILLVLFLVVSIYLPSLFLHPEYDFIYAVCAENSSNKYLDCENYRTGVRHDVVGGRIVRTEVDRTFEENYYNPILEGTADVRLFYHDVDTNVSREVSINEAQDFRVSGDIVSPDGYTLDKTRRGSGGFFPFFYDGGSRSVYVMKKGNREKEVNLIVDSGSYYYRYGNSFEFVGWIIE